MKIKVCGMRDGENIQAVAALGADYLGFIFYPKSKRYVGKADMSALRELPPHIKKTGVFVDASYQEIKDTVIAYGLDAVQLHGEETPVFCKTLQQDGLEVIKAFGVHEGFYFYVTEPYLECTDYFLFDTKVPEYGGSGISFNWNELKNYPYSKPYFLSGGIGPDNLSKIALINDERLYAIDLNSKFEVLPALKDVEKLTKAFEQIKNFPAVGQSTKRL
ncbi:MAG: phosphoribosylanthranilate isomerase [Sphingobacteriaceae bacterium]|jgi:phosphoribosylanthranilate isomerase|nr:phosphoribosylanthranilate isomerase [Sphingobacteriaceae bacterium]